MGFQRICSTVCLILGLTALVRAEVPYVTCGSSVKLVLDTLGVKMLGNEVIIKNIVEYEK